MKGVMTTLGEIATWGSGGTPKRDRAEFFDGDIPWAVIGDLNDGLVTQTSGRITELGLSSSSAKWIEAGSVMVAMYGSIGKLGIAAQRMTSNQAIAFGRPHDDVDARYLFWYLRRMRSELMRLGRGGTQRNIGQGTIKSLPFFKPPLEHQQLVVEEIEKQFTRLAAARESIASALTKVARYRVSVLQAAVNGRLIPAAFRACRLRDVATMRLGKMLSQASKVGVDPVPYLRNINVRWNRIDTDDLSSMDFSEREREEFRLEVGDVLVCEGGEPGRAAVWQNQVPGALFQKALHRVRTDTSLLLPQYLVIHLWADALAGRLHQYFTGSTIKHFTGVALKKYELRIPDVTRQEAIIDEVERRLSLLDVLSGQIDGDSKRLDALREAILRQAFSGALARDEAA